MEPLDGILKQIKESFGFSEKKVAEDLGISRQKLNYWKGKGFPRKYEDGKKLIE
jgi:transcriptional regulator with XRE-family HTH domain